MNLVSIIVPVYNAEEYIMRCLDSIITQTFTAFELLLIDDGSPDRSGAICDEYAQKDSRIRVIHKENGGVASARQTGMDAASGEYVIHADPDDWVEKEWISELYEVAKETNADIVSCDYYREYENESVYKSERPSSFDNQEIIKDLLNERIWGSTWNKLVKRVCFKKYQISFIPEMNLWEDLMVFTKLLHHGAKLVHIDKALYHYDFFTNSQSIVRKVNMSHINSQLLYIDYIDSKYGNYTTFAESIYKCKIMIKRRLFYLGYKNHDLLISTCGEINERFLQENGKWNGNVFYYSIALCLRGYPRIGHAFYTFMTNYYSPIMSKIRK